MSYRGFKRYLGETNLERKCRYLFGACLSLLIFGSFLWYGRTTETHVEEQNRQQQNRMRGRMLVDTIFAFQHLNELETDSEEFRRTIVHPFIEELQKKEYEWTFIRRKGADDVADTSDPFEQELWQRFTKSGPPETATGDGATAEEAAGSNFYRVERYRDVQEAEGAPARPIYEYYKPIYAKTLCIDCHRASSRPDLQLGTLDAVVAPPALAEDDLMALAKITLPNRPTQVDATLNRAILGTFAIGTFVVAMIAAYFIVKYVIIKPLTHLREVSDEISHGNIDLRAEIHTGDEFEALGVAFNRMLRHMVAAQEELKQLNVNLDVKVDELAQVNMQLFEMNRVKSDFLAVMSHELRTPLNSILGFSDVLGSIDSLDERQKRYVQNIQKSGRTLLEMINDILDLAKIESGKAEVRLSDFRIGDVVGAQCDMARPLSEKKNIDLDVEIQPNLPELHQDQGKIQQVLNNLLSNAIKFTPEGGRITVSARRDPDGKLALVVADTGVGIAEEDQTQIFEKFRQGKTVLAGGDAMTREYSGTGLGLSIVKELCKLLGGEVVLQSELGKGSTFTIRLPWTLVPQPRLDSPLAESLEGLGRPRPPQFDGALPRGLPATQAAE